jgi:lactoylglutathione lyase
MTMCEAGPAFFKPSQSEICQWNGPAVEHCHVQQIQRRHDGHRYRQELVGDPAPAGTPRTCGARERGGVAARGAGAAAGGAGNRVSQIESTSLAHFHGVKLAMRLNRIDIAVNDVSAARAFLETYFDLHCVAERGHSLAIMRDDAGVIVALSNFGHAKEVTYPKGFHVGFFQNTKERVDEIFERLQADGYAPMQPKNMHGAWT